MIIPDYKIKDDIRMILEAEKLTIDELFEKIGIPRRTYYGLNSNLEHDMYLEQFYSYAYKNKYRFNVVKEQFLKEGNKNTVLFHGSKKGLTDLIVNGSRNNCDFGSGFYLGETFSQALAFVCDFAYSSIYSFEINLDGLNVLNYDCSLEWMLSICANRGYLKEYIESEKLKKLLQREKEADVIIAPIADNKMLYIMSTFASGDINADVALHSLSASRLGNQYVLKTQKAINNLVPKERYFICNYERFDCQNKLIDRGNEIDSKLKLAKVEFKNGKYVTEIFNERF